MPARKNVTDFLSNKSEPMLVLYYAVWCPHCTMFMGKNLKREDRKDAPWEVVKRRAKKEVLGLRILEIEGDDMALLPEKHRVQAFPILKLYAKGSDKPGLEYHGYDRSPESIMQFLYRYGPKLHVKKKPEASKAKQ